MAKTGPTYPTYCDSLYDKDLPARFRTPTLPLVINPKLHVDLRGFNDLAMSASAQISENTFQAVRKNMKGKIWIVDLRQESHGFIDGVAIDWLEGKNEGNKGLNLEEMQHKERTLLEELQKNPTVSIHEIISMDSLGAEIAVTRKHEVRVQKVETEAELAKRLGVEYIRIPVSDRGFPSAEQVDRFLNLPQDAWLHFHCMGGVGRASTLMLMLDMLHHGNAFSLETYLNRQYWLLGKETFLYGEPDVKWPLWMHIEIRSKNDFLERFHCFASDAKRGNLTWSQWNEALKKPPILVNAPVYSPARDAFGGFPAAASAAVDASSAAVAMVEPARSPTP